MIEIPSADPVVQSLSAWVTSINLDLLPQRAMTFRLNEMRFKDLVLGLLNIDCGEAAHIEWLSGSYIPSARCPERFFETLQHAIQQFWLYKLFVRTRDGEHHRGICPSAYNERTGEHYPEEMARWRADFRAMTPERQMMATTIIWMYRSGSDSIWLRRVPCTWQASEALHCMHDAGCFTLWLQLVARYPGW